MKTGPVGISDHPGHIVLFCKAHRRSDLPPPFDPSAPAAQGFQREDDPRQGSIADSAQRGAFELS